MSSNPRWLGLDVGGANLKAADARGYAREVPFPLWRNPSGLTDALVDLINSAPDHDRLAVTMTGELADCYATKQEGVASIVDAVARAACSRPADFYDLRGARFVSADAARRDWLGVAASNWHALATVCGRITNARGLLIDVGSTTTDIVPFGPAGPTTLSITDTDRLLAGELLYQGVGRTPICAVAPTLPLDGRECPTAAELFATTADAALLLGHTAESDACATADGRPATVAFARARLARMVCADAADLDDESILGIASRIIQLLENRLASCLAAKFRDQDATVVTSGAGEWLATRALARVASQAEANSLASLIGRESSVCAPAWAVAILAGQGTRL